MSLSRLIPTRGGRISFRKAIDVAKGWGKEVHVANVCLTVFKKEEQAGGYCGEIPMLYQRWCGFFDAFP
jgi:hypothetical protein